MSGKARLKRDSTASKSKSTRLEKDIEREILTWLNLQPRCKAWKNKSQGTFDPTKGIFRRNGGAFTEKGTSDILGIYRGKMLCIEVKSAKGRLRPEQKEFLQRMADLGAVCMMARSLEDVISLFAAFFGNESSDQKGFC